MPSSQSEERWEEEGPVVRADAEELAKIPDGSDWERVATFTDEEIERADVSALERAV